MSAGYASAVVGDLAVLRAINARLVDAALAAVEDLAFGRQVGKLLGDRHVTGDLTGLSRLRFGLAGQHPLRFRIVYRLLNDDTDELPVIEVLAIGERADVIVYRDTVARLDPTGDTPSDASEESSETGVDHAGGRHGYPQTLSNAMGCSVAS